MAQYSTTAFLLRKIPYSETSLILKCLTKDKGLRSFIFQGAQRKNKKGNILQSLACVEMNCFDRNDSDLGKISSVTLAKQWSRIPFEIERSTVVMFMTDTLNHLLPESEPDAFLFEFIELCLELLDEEKFPIEIHIYFLVYLIDKLGVMPQNLERENYNYFDVIEGEFTPKEPTHRIYFSQDENQLFRKAFSIENPVIKTFKNGKERMKVIKLLLKYISVHFENFDEPTSLGVLESVFE